VIQDLLAEPVQAGLARWHQPVVCQMAGYGIESSQQCWRQQSHTNS
jgi:hypothetical protein